jgi:hypothetical protein
MHQTTTAIQEAMNVSPTDLEEPTLHPPTPGSTII